MLSLHSFKEINGTILPTTSDDRIRELVKEELNNIFDSSDQTSRFVQQEILDKKDDLLHLGSYTSPSFDYNSTDSAIDISSVNYVIDGKTLNATILLDGYVGLLDNNEGQIFFSILVDNLTNQKFTLEKFFESRLDNITSSNSKIKEESTNYVLADQKAYKVIYEDGSVHRNLEIGTISDNRLYRILFQSATDKFDLYSDIVQYVIESFDITPRKNISSIQSTEENYNSISDPFTGFKAKFKHYNNSHFELMIPISWEDWKDQKLPIVNEILKSTVTFKIPIRPPDSIEYGMILDCCSKEGSIFQGPLYEYVIQWNPSNEKWIEDLYYRDSNGTVLEYIIENKELPYNPTTGNFIKMKYDLSHSGLTQEYKIGFYAKEHRYNTRTADSTPWSILPPPKITLTPLNTSIEIRPGEEATLPIKIDAPQGSPYTINFSLSNSFGMDYIFEDDEGTFATDDIIDLTVKAPYNLKPFNGFTNIKAELSFRSNELKDPQAQLIFDTRQLFESDISQEIEPLIVKVNSLPPYTIYEVISNWLKVYSLYMAPLPIIITAITSYLFSRFIKLRNSPILKDLSPNDIMQIDATVIVGVLVLLTIGGTTQYSSLSITIMTATMVFPFAISAIIVTIKGSVESGLRLTIAGFIYLMVAVVLMVFIGR